MGKSELNIDKENLTLITEHTFDAPVEEVWSAFSDQAILEKWWAPKPWWASTVKMDFREGGEWHYCMNGPEGEKHYGVSRYQSIEQDKSIVAEDNFVDEEGNINKEMPAMEFTNTFEEVDGKTKFRSVNKFADAESMNSSLEMGIKEGFAASLDQLDELLTEQN